MIYGFHGKLLYIDLSKMKIKTIKLDEKLIREFIGGSGLAAILLYNQLIRDLNPLSPKAPLLFITGPFTGIVPFGSRYVIAGKSPLTQLWGESTAGGVFPVQLKKTGFDGILITGSSNKPVYIYIDNKSVEIKDASHLWGLSTFETIRTIGKDLGRDVAIATIGPAGENLVKYASILHGPGRIAVAGRTGMGAIMGSKMLKAIVVRGERLPSVAKPEFIEKLITDIMSIAKMRTPMLMLNIIRKLFISLIRITGKAIPKITSKRQVRIYVTTMRTYGTLLWTSIGYYLGDVPAKYFQETVFPIENISEETLNKNYEVKPEACPLCPIGCGRRIKYGKYGIKEIRKFEYETLAALGPTCGIFDLDAILYTALLVDNYGMDSISTGVTIAFAMYLYERGILSKEKLDGLELKWGNVEAVIKIIDKIAKREGIGAIFAEGAKFLAQKLNVDIDEVAVVKGLEIPMHDPRAFILQGFGYAVSTRGACHLRPDYHGVDVGLTIPELNITPTHRFKWDSNKMKMFITFQNLREVYDSLPLCKFAINIYSPSDIANIYSAITGIEVTSKDLNKLGDRIYTIKRLINLKLGMKVEDEKLPKIVTKPLTKGPTAGISLDVTSMLKEYYRQRCINPKTGFPSKEKLNELGLSKYIK